MSWPTHLTAAAFVLVPLPAVAVMVTVTMAVAITAVVASLAIAGVAEAAGEPASSAQAGSIIGSIRDLRPLNPSQIPIDTPVEVNTGGPPYLLSDNPEWITTPGLHSLATFGGKARFFWFIANHTPPSDGPLYVTLVGENRGVQPAAVRVTRVGYRVGADSERAGQDALYRYLADPAADPAVVIIPPGSRQFVLPELNRQRIFKGWVSVLYAEVEVDQPVTFYVEAVHQPTVEVAQLRRLPPEESEGSDFLSIRGTFPASEREMHFVINQLPARLLIAADQFHPDQQRVDPYLIGIDEMTGRQTINEGNYGLAYRLRLTINVPTDRPLGVYFSPVPTSGLATAARVRVPGPHSPMLVLLPRHKGVRVQSPEEGVLVAIIPPTRGAGAGLAEFVPSEIVLETYPPAGSCAIVPVLIAPLPDSR